MEITFINVGYGDAILIEHDGLWGLIDGGSGIPQEFQGNRISLQSYLSKRNISRLEFIIITHIHEDHVCGLLDCLPNVKIGEFYAPYIPAFLNREDDNFGDNLPTNIMGYVSAMNAYRKLFYYAADHRIPFNNLMEKQIFHPLGADVPFYIAEPTVHQARLYTKRIDQMLCEPNADRRYALLEALERDSNDVSVFIQIGYQELSFLLPADNCPANWREETFSLLENGNVLKLPHHGQIDAVNERLLQHLGADFVVTSSSSDRRHNSSNRTVYEKLRSVKQSIRLMFTDEVVYEPYTDANRHMLQDLRFRVHNNQITVVL